MLLLLIFALLVFIGLPLLDIALCQSHNNGHRVLVRRSPLRRSFVIGEMVGSCLFLKGVTAASFFAGRYSSSSSSEDFSLDDSCFLASPACAGRLEAGVTAKSFFLRRRFITGFLLLLELRRQDYCSKFHYRCTFLFQTGIIFGGFDWLGSDWLSWYLCF